MLKKILETIGSRYLIAFLNLALIFINAKVLGIEGVGMIGLIVASVNIAVIVNGILCGNTIVYFMNRYSMRTIFLSAYLWTPIGSSQFIRLNVSEVDTFFNGPISKSRLSDNE